MSERARPASQRTWRGQIAFALALLVVACLPRVARSDDGGTVISSYKRFYVDSGATGTNDGTSWANAFRDLNAGIGAALAAPQAAKEVWVAAGSYQRPDGAYLVNGRISILGGFAGGETAAAQRDWVAHPTTLRPSVTGNDTAILFSGPGATLDGFVVQGESNAHTPLVVVINSPTKLRNLVIRDHDRGANPPPSNTAGLSSSGSPTLANVTFEDNASSGGAAGWSVESGSPTFDGVSFVDNEGVALVVQAGTVTGSNVTASGSHTRVVSATGGTTLLTNATFAGHGLAVYAQGAAVVALRNAILWGDGGPEVQNAPPASVTLSYSLVRGGCPAVAGVSCNQPPLATNPELEPLVTLGDGARLHPISSASPAVDSGTNVNCPAEDAGGAPRPLDGDLDGTATCDLGAFEFAPAQPSVNFATGSSKANEGANAKLTLSLSTGYPAEIEVPFTAAGTATPGDDHDLKPNGTISIPAYTTSHVVTIPLQQDPMFEGDETVVVTLGKPANATLGAIKTHTLAIVDDEPPPKCDGRPATILGTPAKDTINGTAGPDVVLGLAGDDTINGLGGDDSVCGGPGADTLGGGQGNDRLFAQGGADRLTGGPGRDRMLGGGANDILQGGPAADEIFGGPGTDRIVGEGGEDLLRGNGGNDRLEGGVASDNLFGDLGNDILVGGPGRADRCAGGLGVDSRPLLSHGCEVSVGFP